MSPYPAADVRGLGSVTRVLVVSAEPVGPAMAGPAIRALELARALSAHCRVTLAAPAPSDVGDAPVELLEAGLADFRTLLEALRRHDVVVAQVLPPQLLRYVARMPVRFVADLYNPQMIEVLEAGATDSASPRRSAKVMLGQCAAADFVICASEKQRDLWLGGMGLAGLVDLERYRQDPTFRSFVDVVPFGLPEEPPRRERPVLKGVWPGIGPEDRVLLWAGGIWRWLDPLTPIRALERLRAEGHRAHLVFLGTERPSPDPALIPTSAAEAIAFARERGLEGSAVHFNPGWMPYAERGAYLLEADLGVCAHHDHLEARFSFRTRVLDHIWAGLPSVLTGGDAIGELVERRELGAAVAPGDHAAFAAACARLLQDAQAHAQTAERLRSIAPSFRWSEAARPLIEFCLKSAGRPRRRVPAAVLARATFGQYPDILADLYDRGGASALARRVPQHFARVLRHRA
jgi:glycosyltransferase involved in cell wall biosynthesis